MSAARLMPFALLAAVGIAAACSSFDATGEDATDAGSEAGAGSSNGQASAEGGSSCPQTDGDCQKVVCHADGTRTMEPDDLDVPPATACTKSACANGQPQPTALPAGAACGDGGTCVGNVCLGQACSDAGECPSGFCADGVCCDEACDGECRSCVLGSPGTKGVCGDIPFNVEDPSYGTSDSCTLQVGGAACNGEGRCLRRIGTQCDPTHPCLGSCSPTSVCLGAPGELCDSPPECASNVCAGGTCQ